MFETKRYSDAVAESLALLRTGAADAWPVLASSLIQLDACGRWSEFAALQSVGSTSARFSAARCAVARGATAEALRLFTELAARVGVGIASAMSAKMHVEILRSARTVVPRSGALIVALQKGEASSKGVRPLDILVAADGEPVRIAADATRARMKAASAPQIRWTLWRSGHLVQVTTRPVRLGVQLIDW